MCYIIPFYTFFFQQPSLHPAATQTFAISLFASIPNHLCHFGIVIWLLSSFQIIVISTSGHAKEAAHLCHRILAAEFFDCPILDKWPHFLSIAPRKSRSISSRSYPTTRGAFLQCPFSAEYFNLAGALFAFRLRREGGRKMNVQM